MDHAAQGRTREPRSLLTRKWQFKIVAALGARSRLPDFDQTAVLELDHNVAADKG
jgi:hypothetical protein